MTKHRGLGRGLESLIRVASPTSAQQSPGADNSGKPLMVSIKNVQPCATQPRKNFEQDTLNELAESIREYGIIQPIVVRKKGMSDYEIIAGERRWQAAQIAGMKEVPVLINNVNDMKQAYMSVIENVHREDLNPIEEARFYAEIQRKYDVSISAMAKTVGKSRSHISNLIRILELPQNVQDMLERKDISFGHAKVLITMDNCEAIAKQIVSDNLSVRDLEQLKNNGSNATATASSTTSGKKDDLSEVAQYMSEALNSKVNIAAQGGKGKIVINFDDLISLDSILQKLRGEN